MSNSTPNIDQFCAGFSTGDAISNEALMIQTFLKSSGFKSAIYCEQYSDQDSERVSSYRNYHDRQNSVIIYHHSFHTRILQKLSGYSGRKILIFHNVTPPGYVEPYNRTMKESLSLALNELAALKDNFDAVLSPSEFNARVLRDLGFQKITIMPIPLNNNEISLRGEPPPYLRYLLDGRINILFVGRVFPNKKHVDLLKTFFFFRKIEPNSRLLLVGPYHPGVRGYTAELNNYCTELEFGDSVIFTDMVSDQDLHFYYKYSHLFFSMSDHEGFFVPLLESMKYGLPILAYGSSVIPETLGASGVIFFEKDYCRIAEMMFEIVKNKTLRNNIIQAQRERLSFFEPEKSLAILQKVLGDLGVT